MPPQRAPMQADAREMIAEITVQLRQAITADLNGELVESLSGDRLVFYTTNYDTLAPERVEYERVDCVEGLCELWVYRYAMVSSDGIAYTFAAEPFESSFLFGGVLAGSARVPGRRLGRGPGRCAARSRRARLPGPSAPFPSSPSPSGCGPATATGGCTTHPP